MKERKETPEEYYDICVYSFKFWTVVFTLGALALIVPFRIWFTYNLHDWHQAALEEDDEIVIENRGGGGCEDHVEGLPEGQ